MSTLHVLKLGLAAQGNLDDVTLLQDITEVCRATVRAFVEERTDKNDQVCPHPEA